MTCYGICDCGKWGLAPKEFRENKHFLKYECGKLMYLDHLDPKTAGFNDKNKINTITVVKQ